MKKLKDSGVEWIGQIPAEWKRVKLKEVTNIIMGQSPEAQDIKDFGNIPFMQGNREFGSIYPNAVKFCDNSPKKSRIGDILLSVRAPVGAINVSDKVYAIGRGLCSICATSINSKFLMYFLMLIMQDTKKFGQGSTFDAITIQELKQLPVLLPPINTQNRIASYLDRKCAEIDAIIAKQQQIIEKLKEYKLSVITEAVTKGLNPNVPMKDSGVEWIGKIPEHWVTGKIKNFCNLKTGSTPSTSNTEWFDGTIRWFTPGDFVETFILKDSARTLSQKAKDDMVAVIVPPNTVMIVGIGATAGKIGYTMVECSCNQQITAINTNKIMPKYLMYWMIANTKFLRDTAMFTTLPILNNQTIGNYLVMFPDDRNEEKEVVDYLDGKCDKIEILIEAKKHEIDRLHRYKKSIIYEIVTGKMEV